MPRTKKFAVSPVEEPEIQSVVGQPEGVYEEIPRSEEPAMEEPSNILHMIPRGTQLESHAQEDPIEIEEIGEDDPLHPEAKECWEPVINGDLLTFAPFPASPAIEEESEEPAPYEDLATEEEEEESPPLQTFKGSLVWANLRNPVSDSFFAKALTRHATMAFDLRVRKGEKVPSTPAARMEAIGPKALRSRYGMKILSLFEHLGDADDANPKPHTFDMDQEKALETLLPYMERGYHVILFETCAQEPTLSLALAELFKLHYPGAVIQTLQEFAAEA